ncbi:PKD domain-containing protein, partial [Candidatus Saccharibacteria bacterium]|nr:PKD domain-containing protein [Candidatus Saccharibacteria bacterium]
MFHIGNIKKKVKLSFVAGLTMFGLLVGATGVVATNTVSAQSCDKVNIIYCGLNGSSASGYISSLRNIYNNNKDTYGNTDIKAVMRWSGFTDAKIKGMNTGNTKVGTLYRNGDIKVGGKLVANNTWVSARFGAGQAGFKHVEGNVWARLTTTSFANPSVPVLIHYNADGVPDAGVMVHCGNALQFHPTVPPKPSLVCDNLSKDVVEGSMRRTYTFTAQASAKHTTITNYVFNFGDGKSQTVNTSKEKATTKEHTYAPGKTYTATVTVNSKDVKGVTSKDCKISVVVPKASLSCDLLTATPTATENEFKLTAKASAANTVITGYDFSFGDGSNDQRVATDKKQASVTHTYAAGKTYTATVNVDSKDIKNVTSKKCKVTIKTPEAPNPGVSITKLVNGKKLDNVTVGGEFTYQLKVTNDGNVALKDVVVTDTPAADTN